MTKSQMLTAIAMLKDGLGSEDIAVKLAETSGKNTSFWLGEVRALIASLREMGELARLVRPA